MKRKRPIAEQLKVVLGGDWKAVRDGFCWYYVSTDGRTVRRYAEPILEWDGYSDTNFAIVYYDDQGNRVPIGWGGLKPCRTNSQIRASLS